MGTTQQVKIGARVLRVDEVVKVSGLRGEFVIQGFDVDQWAVDLFGGTPGPRGHRSFRTVSIDRIGVRPVESNRRRRMASASK